MIAMTAVTGTTADLRRRWTRVARHLDAAVAELSGAGTDFPETGLAVWLDNESADYRTMIALHVMHSAELLSELARVEAQTVEGYDPGRKGA